MGTKTRRIQIGLKKLLPLLVLIAALIAILYQDSFVYYDIRNIKRINKNKSYLENLIIIDINKNDYNGADKHNEMMRKIHGPDDMYYLVNKEIILRKKGECGEANRYLILIEQKKQENSSYCKDSFGKKKTAYNNTKAYEICVKLVERTINRKCVENTKPETILDDKQNDIKDE